MKNSILNYQFFKSYRLPVKETDKVLIDVDIIQRDNQIQRNIKNLRIESINLSGLNFISPIKIKIGERVSLHIKSNKLFHKWDFSLSGTIVRSFICENNISEIVYGVLLDKKGDMDALAYFLKDYISQANKNEIKNHLFLASTLNRKFQLTEGVELFSLFFSIIEDIFKESPKELLNDLAQAFKSQYYSIHLVNEDTGKLEYSRSNFQNIEVVSSSNQNQLMALKNNGLVNYNNSKDHDENIENKEVIYNSISHPICNRLQRPVGVVTIYNTIDKKPFKNTQETSLKLFCQVFSHYFEDYNSKIKKTKNKNIMIDNFIGQNRINMDLKNSVDTIKNSRKNILIGAEQGCKKHEIIEYILDINTTIPPNIIIFDFKTLDSINKVFSEIDKIQVKKDSVLWIKEINKLSHEKQNRIYDFIKNSNIRVFTESTTELYNSVKNGKVLKKLYFLIAEIYIHLIPLRNRKNDLIEISTEILNNELTIRELPKKCFSMDSIEVLINYNWPGNLKELRTQIRKAILRSYNDQEINLSIKSDQSIQAKKNKSLFQLLRSTTSLHDQSISYENHVREFKKYFNKKESA